MEALGIRKNGLNGYEKKVRNSVKRLTQTSNKGGVAFAFKFEDFEKIVFLTREEAEAKLKEMEV